MKRRHFLGAAGAAGALLQERRAAAQTAPAPVEIHPGVWKFSFGNAEEITPAKTRRYAPAEAGLKELPVVAACPVTVRGSGSRRGYLLRIPLAPNEIVYGLGLQLQSLIQRGLKKKLRVNADPKMDTGDSHAPVPFYVTTAGYGVLVDTARYTTFYCGNKKRKGGAAEAKQRAAIGEDALPAAYRRTLRRATEVLIEIPEAEGVDVYVFGGPNDARSGAALQPVLGRRAAAAALGAGHVVPRQERLPAGGVAAGWRTNSATGAFPAT